MAHKKTTNRPPRKELVKSWFPHEYIARIERAAKKQGFSKSLFVARTVMQALDAEAK